MTLRIRTIARMTGIREATLRAWERRYGFPHPHRSACAEVSPEMVARSFVRRREPDEMMAVLSEVVRACAPAPVIAGGMGAREHLKTIFSLGAQYAESADELVALWQQARVALSRT